MTPSKLGEKLMSTNFTRTTGEVWKTTIEMVDDNHKYIKLASVGAGSPVYHAYFTGSASRVLSGNTNPTKTPIKFKLLPSETKTYGRGSAKTTDTGYFKVEAFIQADPNTAVLSTTVPISTVEMEVGDWTYEIIYSDTQNPTDNNNVRVIVSGTITIQERIADLGTTPGTYSFTAPTT